MNQSHSEKQKKNSKKKRTIKRGKQTSVTNKCERLITRLYLKE